MSCLDGKGYRVTAITFEIQAHERKGRFTVPQRIAKELGSGDDLPINLQVETDGATVFSGTVTLASGTEAYPIAGVTSKAALVVTARRA